jgi:hypothetical protein
MSKPIPASASSVLMNERLRVSTILESPEGLARPASAMQLALRSSLSAIEAVDLLRTMPVSNPYTAAMGLEGPVNLSSIGGATVGISGDRKAKRIAEIQANLGGLKKKA